MHSDISVFSTTTVSVKQKTASINIRQWLHSELPIHCPIRKHNLNNLPFAIGMKSRRIYWTKMTLYSAKFFFKYQMEESSVKFSYTSWCGCYIHSLLTASKHHLKNYDRISVLKPLSPKILNRWNGIQNNIWNVVWFVATLHVKVVVLCWSGRPK